ncbi:MAG: HD domain-containing protein [Bacilli bacterium]|nr:HD domain-containing protein [Bacilli bacterium]
MSLYTSFTILTSLLMVAMTIHVLAYSGFNKRQKMWFILTFSGITFCAWAEYAVHCGYYDSKFSVILTILTVMQFSIAPCFAMLFAGALGLKYQGRLAIAYLAINLIAETISAPFGWVFYFNETGYFRADGFLFYEIMYFGSLIYMLAMLVVAGLKFKHRDLGTIIMVLVVLIAGIIPMTIFKLHVAYLAVASGACLCYVYYNDLVTQDMNSDLLNKQIRIAKMQIKIVSGLAGVIESRDNETGEHVTRTSAYVQILAKDCKNDGVYADIIDDHFIDLIHTLAPMHDVGKILVSDKILRKPGKLTPEEFEEMKKHATYGGDVVRQVLSDVTDEEYVNFASDIATYHHERWDGKGYPKGLKGDEIPLSARIMAIADVFDALVSKRVYKDEVSPTAAFIIMESESGTHFDPKLIEIFLRHKDHYLNVK